MGRRAEREGGLAIFSCGFYRSMTETFDMSLWVPSSGSLNGIPFQHPNSAWSTAFFGIGPTGRLTRLLSVTFNFSRVSQRLKSWGESGEERKWEQGRRN